MKNLEKLNKELQRLFDLFNTRYYNGELKHPVINIQSNGGRGQQRLVLGWCTCNSDNNYYYEITICSEYLYRSVEEICTTLLHEMVHLYCNENGIKDTSRGNTYHNKRFKEIAESHGLKVSYSQRIGWSESKLTDEAQAFITEKADKSVFVVTRVIHTAPKEPLSEPIDEPDGTDEQPEPGEQKRKQSSRKYVCPKCGCIIRATKEVNVLCGDCKVAFIES